MSYKLLFSVLLLLSIAAAHEEAASLYLDLQVAVADYNAHVQDVPGWARSIFSNQRINLYVDDQVFGIDSRGTKIVNFTDGSIEKPTLNVYTTDETVQQLLTSNNTVADLKAALDNGTVRYEGVTVGNKVKLFFANLLFKLGSLLGLVK